MKHFIRDNKGNVWDPTHGWSVMTDDTRYYADECYVSLSSLLVFYATECVSPDDPTIVSLIDRIASNAGVHVYVDITPDD